MFTRETAMEGEREREGGRERERGVGLLAAVRAGRREGAGAGGRAIGSNSPGRARKVGSR